LWIPEKYGPGLEPILWIPEKSGPGLGPIFGQTCRFYAQLARISTLFWPKWPLSETPNPYFVSIAVPFGRKKAAPAANLSFALKFGRIFRRQMAKTSKMTRF
jgi:hypothetical protein